MRDAMAGVTAVEAGAGAGTPTSPVSGRVRAGAALLVVLGVVEFATALATTADRSPYPLWVWVPLQLTGVSFVLSGAVAWVARPANRTGPMLIAVGLTWYIGDLQFSGVGALHAIGFCLFYVPAIIAGHLIAALPTGRLQEKVAKAVVAGAYVLGPLTQTLRYVTEASPGPQVWGDPQTESSVWATVGSIYAFIAAALVVVVVVRRWRASGAATRSEYRFLWTAIALTGVTAALVAAASALTARQYLLVVFSIAFSALPAAIVAGLVRDRIAGTRVAPLVLRLQSTFEPVALQRALAEALGDPELEVRFRSPDGSGYMDAGGRKALAVARDGQTATPVIRYDRELAVLLHDPVVAERRELLDAVVAAAGLALENARLYADLRAQLEEVRDSRSRLVVASDGERRRIQRDLHDGVQHRLLAISMLVDRARVPDRNGNGAAPDGDQFLESALTELRTVVRELRELTEGIYPPALAEQGIRAAAEVLAERAPVPVDFTIPDRRWPEAVEQAAYFVITEALTNVYKHADAHRVVVDVTGDDSGVTVDVTDDGRGGADVGKGTGLQGLRDRVGALDGTLGVVSSERGTRVKARIPCG